MSTIHKLKEEYPAGSMLYHKSTGQGGVVVGWGICHQGDAFLLIDQGNEGRIAEDPICLTTTKAREEGDEWKDGLEKS